VERVFAKYQKIKTILENLLEQEDDRVRKLMADGILHVFDAENPLEEDSSPGHRLNVGIYDKPNLILDTNSLNTIFLDHRLPIEVLKQQITFFVGKSGVLLDVAFSLNQEKYDELKNNLKELRGIEQVLEKVHYDHVPLRKYQFNNMKFYSKYLVGESIGGDYFDIEEVNKKVYFFLASFNSYVSSVNFIKNISVIKNSGGDIFSKVEKYIKEIKDEVKGLFLFEIDQKKSSMRFLKRGTMYLHSMRSDIYEDSGEIELKASDYIFIGSSGFQELMSDYNGKPMTGVSDEKELAGLYNDFFSFLNNKKTGRFLPCDATFISLVVNEKLIKEVNQNE